MIFVLLTAALAAPPELLDCTASPVGHPDVSTVRLVIDSSLDLRAEIRDTAGSTTTCFPELLHADASETARVDDLTLEYGPGDCAARGIPADVGPAIRWRSWTAWSKRPGKTPPSVLWVSGSQPVPCVVAAVSLEALIATASAGVPLPTPELSARIVTDAATSSRHLEISVPCAEGICPLPPTPVGDDEEVGVVGWVDLAADARTVSLARKKAEVSTPMGASRPAVIVVSRRDGTAGDHATTAVLFELRDGTTREVWRMVIDERQVDGGGISTRSELHLVAPLEAGSPLALEIEGEAMPAEGDAEFRPGPPMRFRFDFRDDRYVQTRP